MKLNARQLRDLGETPELHSKTKRNPIYFILDSIYDTYNIGGLFRLADALHIEKIYICGESETPPNHKIKKASIGTYKIVPWEYVSTAVKAVESIKYQVSSIKVVAIEQHAKAVPYTNFNYTFPLALIVGNETTGVSPAALEASDAIVEIPMHGVNKSLNVIVSAAIVGYHVVSTL